MNIRGKGDKPRRVEIPEFFIKAFKDAASQGTACVCCDYSSDPDRFLITGERTGEAAGRNVVCHAIKKYTGGYRPHQFRATFCSIMSEEGVPVAEMMARMGHKKADTTMAYVSRRDNVASQKIKNSSMLRPPEDNLKP